eukprot:SAG22_NODE_66_length_22936_cov_626.714279_7_plen_70_part_00
MRRLARARPKSRPSERRMVLRVESSVAAWRQPPPPPGIALGSPCDRTHSCEDFVKILVSIVLIRLILPL